ncbi:MAG: M20/M25/M40 family metallo-hydrolase, partial [candidate division WOR-3 bacterium]
ELQRLTFKAYHPLFEVPHPNLSVTMIQGGAKINIIPERCTFSIDRRLMPGETSASVREEIEKVLRECSGDGISAQVQMIHEGWNPYAIDPNSPWVKTLCETIHEVVGHPPQIKGKAGCTDASHLYHLGKIPSVCFGPGLEDLAHAANERVALEKVVQAAKVFVLSAVTLLT